MQLTSTDTYYIRDGFSGLRGYTTVIGLCTSRVVFLIIGGCKSVFIVAVAIMTFFYK